MERPWPGDGRGAGVVGSWDSFAWWLLAVGVGLCKEQRTPDTSRSPWRAAPRGWPRRGHGGGGQSRELRPSCLGTGLESNRLFSSHLCLFSSSPLVLLSVILSSWPSPPLDIFFSGQCLLFLSFFSSLSLSFSPFSSWRLLLLSSSPCPPSPLLGLLLPSSLLVASPLLSLFSPHLR